MRKFHDAVDKFALRGVLESRLAAFRRKRDGGGVARVRGMARLLTVLTGFSLIAGGVYVEGLAGVVLTIAGLVPAVVGIANVSVLRDVREEQAHRREQEQRLSRGRKARG